MMPQAYPDPVSQLLSLGHTEIHDMPDYPAMGITREHVPDLIRLAQDTELRDLAWDARLRPPPEVYAQVHAWRALAQLGATEAIPALIGLLHYIDDDDDDYVGEEIPIMLGMLGAAAIEPSRAYLADRAHGQYARIAAGSALSQIGQRHPELREAAAQALMSTLHDYQADDETINAFTLSYLADLKAVEAASLAQEIFEADRADLDIAGDFEDWQVQAGILKKRLTEPTYRSLLDKKRGWPSPSVGQDRRLREQAKKEKNKRKQAKRARKRSKKK